MVVLKKVRSYVRREGRITPGQRQALLQNWEQFGIDFVNDSQATPDWSQIFGRAAPVVVDIGFGNGESVIELAQAHPEWNIIGIEVYRPGIGHLMLRLRELQINNVRVFNHDAVEVLQTTVLENSLSRVQIFFPDPWPKKRHHKRRLVQTKFVQLLTGRLQSGGELLLATDWQEYADHMLEVLSQELSLSNTAEGFAAREELRPLTRFERRGQLAGHEVWDLKFKKK